MATSDSPGRPRRYRLVGVKNSAVLCDLGIFVEEPCACRLLRPCRSCSGSVLVLVEDAAEPVPSEDRELFELAWLGERLGCRP